MLFSNDIPSYNSSFVGRDSELDSMKKFFRSNSSNCHCEILGPGGIGKTALAYQYATLQKGRYSNIYAIHMHSHDLESIRNQTNSLIILNDCDFITIQELVNIFDKNVNTHLITTSRKKIVDSLYPTSILNLHGLNKSEGVLLLNSLCDCDLSEVVKWRIINESLASPLLLTLIGKMIQKEGIKHVEQIIYHSLFDDNDLDYNEIKEEGKRSKFDTIKINTIYVNQNIMSYLAVNPKLMYKLSPRDFEEMIAELYIKLGYTVELTKQTHDGGKDLYVAHKTDIGEFLYLVECKKYSPNRTVGIEVLRNLYGVIGMDDKNVNGGIIATTSYFSQDARNHIRTHNLEHRITLQDYDYIEGLLKKAYK